MAQSNVPITAGSGTKVDTFVTAIQANNRQAVVIADPSTDAAASAVKNIDAASSDYGMVTRDPNAVTLAGIVRAEDSASADADKGIAIFAVRKASPANTSGTDGDYEALQMSAGRLWVSAIIDTALPAGTNAIGKLAANSGVDIGDIDVTSIIPGTAATNLGKAEDAVHASGDTGVMSLAVGNVAQSTLAADGDYIPHAVDVKGNTMIVGNVASASTDAGNPVKVGGINLTTLPTLTDGQRGDLQVSTRGALYTVLKVENSSTAMANRADNADGVAVSATANNLGISSRGNVFNGVSWDRMPGNTNGVYELIRDAAGNARGANVSYQNRLYVERAADGVTISGNVLLAQQRQPINVNSNGQILISGIANRVIRVLNGLLVSAGIVTVNIKSNNNTDCSGPIPLVASTGFTVPHADLGNFETRTGENLTISMSAGIQVGGYLTYVIV